MIAYVKFKLIIPTKYDGTAVNNFRFMVEVRFSPKNVFFHLIGREGARFPEEMSEFGHRNFKDWEIGDIT